MNDAEHLHVVSHRVAQQVGALTSGGTALEAISAVRVRPEAARAQESRVGQVAHDRDGLSSKAVGVSAARRRTESDPEDAKDDHG